MQRQTIIDELQRVAASLRSRSLSRSTFARHATISTGAVEAALGSWTEAIVAAGLQPLPQGGLPKSDQRRLERIGARAADPSIVRVSDEELLDDLMRLAQHLGRRSSGNQIAAKGKFGRDVYQKRWGSVARAYEVARARRIRMTPLRATGRDAVRSAHSRTTSLTQRAAVVPTRSTRSSSIILMFNAGHPIGLTHELLRDEPRIVMTPTPNGLKENGCHAASKPDAPSRLST